MEINGENEREKNRVQSLHSLHAESIRPGGLVKELMQVEDPVKALGNAATFMELMSRYRCAMMEVDVYKRQPLGLLDTAPVASQEVPSPVRPSNVRVGNVETINSQSSCASISGVAPLASRAAL